MLQTTRPECLIDLSHAKGSERIRPVVLVDDLFRCDGIEEVLQDPQLRCTIVGASRTNEYRPGMLRSTANVKKLFPPGLQKKERWPELGRPTLNELDALRKKPECKNLSDEDWLRVTTIRHGNEVRIAPLLVIMLQLSADGKPFDEIITHSIEFLRKNYPETCDAFQILCAFHQHGHPTPTCVLQRLARGGSAYIAQLREELVKGHGCVGSKGIIFSGDSHLYAECWETGHELIAEVANKKVYGDLTDHYVTNLILTADPRENEEFVFVSHILRTLTVRGRPSFVAQLLAQHPNKIEQFVRADTSQQAEWAVIFDKLGQMPRVHECLETVNPKSPLRTVWMIELALKYGLKPKALSLAEGWLSGHPDDSFVRTKFLGLIERLGTDDEKKQAIKTSGVWLTEHPDDSSVRTRFLGLVEGFGTEDEKKQAIETTSVWLTEHPDNVDVRKRFLKTIERFGSTDQIQKMLPLVKEWRAKDPSLQYRYARLLLRVGDPLGAIVEFRAILKTQQDHQMAYLGLGDSHKHLGMQARFGGDNDATKRHFAEAERAYQKALFWARRKSEGTAVILTHLGWLHIDQERWNEARNFFRTARDEEPGYFGNYWGLGRAEKGLGRTTEAIKAFETALQLAPQNTDAQTIAEITKALAGLASS